MIDCKVIYPNNPTQEFFFIISITWCVRNKLVLCLLLIVKTRLGIKSCKLNLFLETWNVWIIFMQADFIFISYFEAFICDLDNAFDQTVIPAVQL